MFKAAGKLLYLQWSFIPPASPGFGGFYERLVKAVSAIEKSIGKVNGMEKGVGDTASGNRELGQ